MHWSLVYLALVPPALLFLFAAVIARSAIRRLRAGAATRAWPAAAGRITYSGFRRELTTDGEGGSHELFAAEVRYTYQVDGATLQGETIHLNGEPSASRARAERLARRYPEGAAVRVFYDLDDPSRAVLERGIGAALFGYLAMAALLAIAGLYAARLMCSANPAVAAGAPGVCGLVPAWVAIPPF
ncbi:MAG TPA: DUF3592 domain-containing protein [Longimicrobium sp.]|jgi:hypothetical protein